MITDLKFGGSNNLFLIHNVGYQGGQDGQVILNFTGESQSRRFMGEEHSSPGDDAKQEILRAAQRFQDATRGVSGHPITRLGRLFNFQTAAAMIHAQCW